MEKIDVIILAKNEEEVIESAIKSAKGFAENIIVVNSGSTDSTFEVAKRNKAQVIDNNFRNFSQQRNFAIRKAKSPWVMYLDADEVLTQDFKDELKGAISSGKFSGFEIKRKTYFFGKDWGFEDRVARVFQVDKFDEWKGVVHETAFFTGEMGLIKSPIKHYTHRSIEQMLEKTNEWSEFEAKLRFDSKHPKMKAWRFFRVMVSEFVRSYFKEKGYKNGTYGLIEAIYQSYSIFITYVKLWEMQINKKD